MLIYASALGIQMVIMHYDEETGKVRSVPTLLQDADFSTEFYDSYLTSTEALEVPYIISNEAVPLGFLTQIFEGVTDPEKTAKDETFMSLLRQQVGVANLSSDSFLEMLSAYKELIEYLKGRCLVPINISPEAFRNPDGGTRTQELVNAIKGRVTSFGGTVSDSKFRETPDDELSIVIPGADRVFLDEPTTLIPSLKEVFNPYGDAPGLNTFDYRRFLDKIGGHEEYVIGDVDKITDEIYPEEVNFYNSLVNLHNSCLIKTYGEEKLEECISQGVYSKEFVEYMYYFLEEVVRYHWNHGGKISLKSYVDEDINEEDEDVVASSKNKEDDSLVKINAEFRIKNEHDFFNGSTVLKRAVALSSRVDIYASAKLLIQALRFGYKKPRKLVLATGEYLDLNTFKLSETSGSFKDCEVKKTPLGNNYSINSILNANYRVYDSMYIRDNGINSPIIDVPIGLSLVQEFEGTEQFKVVNISFVDLLNSYGKDPSLTIDGITMEGSRVKFNEEFFGKEFLELNSDKIPLSSYLATLSNDTSLSAVYYSSVNFKKAFIDNNCYNSKLNLLTIFNEFIEKQLSSLRTDIVISQEELEYKVESSRIAPEFFLKSTVADNIAKLTCVVNDKFKEVMNHNFVVYANELITMYYESMNELGYRGNVFLDEDSTMESPQPSTPSMSTPLTPSNSFGGEMTPVNTAPVEEVKPFVSEPISQVAQEVKPNIPTTQSTSQPNGILGSIIDSEDFSGQPLKRLKIYVPYDAESIAALEYNLSTVRGIELNKGPVVNIKGNPVPGLSIGTLTVVGPERFIVSLDVSKIDKSYKSMKFDKCIPQIHLALTNIVQGIDSRFRFDSVESYRYFLGVLEFLGKPKGCYESV